MKITLVKKLKADGTLCRKCEEVDALIDKHGHRQRIDEVLMADELNPLSPGMLLAARLGVERAPFFVVQWENGQEDVYTVYLKFAREVLNLSDAELKQVFSSPG